MSDDKTADAIDRGHQASMLLNHPLMVEMLDRYEAANIKAWKSADDTVTREGLWYAVLAAEKLKSGLHAVAANGRVAQAELDKKIAAQSA